MYFESVVPILTQFDKHFQNSQVKTAISSMFSTLLRVIIDDDQDIIDTEKDICAESLDCQFSYKLIFSLLEDD